MRGPRVPARLGSWIGNEILILPVAVRMTRFVSTHPTHEDHQESRMPNSIHLRGTSLPDHHPASVLIVDPDSATRHALTTYLRANNFQVHEAADLVGTAARLRAHQPHLVILEPHLGSEDGLRVLREIRAQSDVPIVITTRHRGGEADRVIGLELGADDYLVKPFGPRELLARIRAILRRKERRRNCRRIPEEDASYLFGGWWLTARARLLIDPADKPVTLTKTGYALLLAFVRAPLQPLSREHLLQATRIHEDVYDRSIDVQILRLRRKLETDPSRPRIIVTERGVGYVFTLPVRTV